MYILIILGFTCSIIFLNHCIIFIIYIYLFYFEDIDQFDFSLNWWLSQADSHSQSAKHVENVTKISIMYYSIRIIINAVYFCYLLNSFEISQLKLAKCFRKLTRICQKICEQIYFEFKFVTRILIRWIWT